MRDLNTLGIDFTLQEIEEMPEKRYKQLMKRKIKEHALKYLINKKERRNAKGKEIQYTDLSMQNYLQSEDIEINNY